MVVWRTVYRILYWTDRSTTRPAIYRSSVINPARKTVISGDLRWPNALSIDFTGTGYALGPI